MVQVQSTWFPVIDRNPQTFVPNIFEARASDFKAATHRIYRSREHPSHVAIPVARPASGVNRLRLALLVSRPRPRRRRPRPGAGGGGRRGTPARALHRQQPDLHQRPAGDVPRARRGGGEVPAVRARRGGPGFSLEDQWNQGDAQKAIAVGSWDYVVLQQGPSASADGISVLRAYSERFAEQIRAAGAKPVLYMVWPSTSRPQDFDGVVQSYAGAARASAVFCARPAMPGGWPGSRIRSSRSIPPMGSIRRLPERTSRR